MSAQALLDLVAKNGVIVFGLQDLLNAAGITEFDGDATSIKNLTSSAGDFVYNDDGTWTFVPISNWNGELPVDFEVVSGDTVTPYSSLVDSEDIATPQTAAIVGGKGADKITGTAGADTIIGGSGNDQLKGGDGDDVFIVGGPGDKDRYDGGAGQDTIRGTTGDDVLNFDSYTGAESIETIDGGDGDDTIAVRYNADFSGTDVRNVERIEGSGFGNVITGSEGADTIVGGGGNDVLKGGGGDDTFIVGPNDGTDQVSGGAGYDTIRGTDADDNIAFGNFTDDDRVEHIDGGEGDDVVSVRYRGDFSETTMENVERIEGSGYANVISGTQGDDVIDGRGGSDIIDGQGGADVLVYNWSENKSAYDKFDGGTGIDTLRIDLTAAEYADPGVQADIAAFQTYLEAKAAGTAPELFKFSTLRMEVQNVEKIDVTVDGVSIFANEAPVVSQDAGFTMNEDGSLLLTQADLLQYASDADGDVMAVQNVTATGGTVADNGDGTWTFTPDADFNGTIDLSYDVSDGEVTTPARGTINVTPVNDAAVVSGDSTGAAKEDTTLTSSGKLVVSDVDAGEASFQPAMVAGAFGALIIDAAGNWSYSLANENSSVQALGEGDTLTDVLTVETADGTTHDVTITITGTNDVPVIGGASTAAVSEDALLSSSGQLTIADADVGEAAFQAASAGGVYGSFTVNESGQWTYDLTANASAAVQALGDGDTLTESFTVQSADGTASQVVTVTITGTNDVAQISGETAGLVTEDGMLSSTGQLAVADADTGQAGFAVAEMVGNYGAFFVDSSGKWTYSLTQNSDPAIQALGEGDILTESFTVTSADGSASQVVTVTIAGTNDVPQIGGEATGTVTEDAVLSSSGQLTVADADAGEAAFVAAESIGSYGSFFVDATGKWTYSLTGNSLPAVQALGDGDTLTETFMVRTVDGTQQAVTVIVAGSHDGPVISGDTEGVVVEDTTMASTGQLNLDGGDAVAQDFATATSTPTDGFQAAELVGAYGSFVMNDAGSWTYELLTNSSPAVQALGDGDTLTETFTVQTADGLATQEIKVTIAGTNDLPVINATVRNATEDTSLIITEAELLAEASDAEGDVLFVQNIATNSGTLVDNGNGSWTFTPGADFNGDVALTYEVSDGTGATPVSTTISVAAVQDAAQISGTAAGSVAEDLADLATGKLAVTDPDAGEAAFQTQAGTAGAYGNFTIDAAGNWNYQLTANSSAEIQALGAGDSLTETFTVKSADGSAMQTVTVTISGTNDAPVVTAPSYGTDQDVAITITSAQLLAQATDIDGDVLSAQNLTVDYGTVADNGDGTWTYTPPAGWNGTANFSYDVFDGTDATTAGNSITVNATAVNLNLIEGTSYGQTIQGTAQDDLIIGKGGDDVMYGNAGNDVFEIRTGDGRDVVSGGEGYDTLRGTSADDDIYLNDFTGTNRVEKIDGGAGTDVLRLRYHGDFTDVEIVNLERIEGSSFKNYIYGSAGDDTIFGAGGDDVLTGNAGDDTFLKVSGDGYDTISGGAGFDTIQGTAGDDRIDLYSFTGDNTVERIDGGEGTDTVGVKYHADFSNTEMVGVESIEGSSLGNIIEGSQGADNIYGLDGNDVLTGNAGDDFLDAGAGTDTVVYAGAFIDYSIDFNADGTVTVRDLRSEGNEGVDTVKNAEYIEFADGKLALSADAIAAAGGSTGSTGGDTGSGDTGTGDTGSGSTGTGDTGGSTGSGTGGGTTETIIYNAELPEATGTDEVVALRFQNTGTEVGGNGYVTLGQVFKAGDIPAGDSLTAMINGQPVELQMDVKATHADGSVRHAILTVASPELQPGDSVDIMLSRAPGGAAGGAVSAQDALANLDLTVDVNLHNADGTDTAVHVDASQILTQAIADGSLSTWLEGPLASEFSVSAPVNAQMDVTFNIRAFADGTIQTDVVFAANKAFTAGNDNLNYDVSIKEGGSEVYSLQNLDHHHKGTWHTEVWTGNDPDVHVIRDMDYFLETGAVSKYDFSMGIKESVLQTAYSGLQNADTSPMGSGTVETYMPGTGGRPDIGPLPTWAVRYLATQDERAEEILFANADAAGGIPWHYVDENTGEVVSIDTYPNLWLDYRAAVGVLPDSVSSAETGWHTDVAHLPSLTYLPYLLSGSQYYLDEMQAQSNYVMASMNPGYRGYDDGIIDRHQLRGQAWSMRELSNTSWGLPDDSPMKNYFNEKLLNNLQNYMNNYALQDPSTDEISGAIQYPSGEVGKISPWQDDYFTMVVSLMADRGDTYAQDLLEWKANFTAGRFLAEDFGFPAIAGTSYRLVLYEVVNGQKQWFESWQEIMDATFTNVGKDIPEELNYPEWAGGYAALARAAVASMVTEGVDGALEAYGFLVSETPLMNADYANDPTFALGLELNEADILRADESVGTDLADNLTGTDDNELIHGLDGDDFILGAGGVDALFGGAGADTIDGGAGDDYLYGGEGDDVIKGGAGDDHIKGGKGADILEGGEGHDTFIYDRLSEAGDIIKDFHDGEDVLDLREVMRVAGQSATVEITQGTTGAEVWIHTGTDDVLLTTVEGIDQTQLKIGDDVLIS